MWNRARAVLCGTEQEQAYVGQSSLIWDREVSYGTEHSHMGKSSLIWDRAVSYGADKSCVGQRSVRWDISDSCRTKQSNIRQSKLKEGFATCDSLKKYLGQSGRTISFVTSFKNILKLVQA